MIIETLKSFVAIGIILLLIGSFLHKTYQVLRNKPPNESPWKRVQANVLAARTTETFMYGKKGTELDLEYTINGVRFTGTGYNILYRDEQPPKTVELVYKPESPEAWEWAEDHGELDGIPSSTRFTIFFVWLLLFLIGGCVIVAIYFPEILTK